MPTERAYVPDTPPAFITADELPEIRIPDKRVELVRGVLVVREPAGLPHRRVALELGRRLANHVAAHGLGRVYAAETGFTVARQPDTVRAPVLSPDDPPGEVLAKVADWLSAGTRRVWVIDPARRVARNYNDDGTDRIITADESLDGEDGVPGFAC